MNENLLEKVCNHPRRWLIVTAVTFVIALASVLPQVDQLLAERSEMAELREQLAQAAETSARLPAYEARVTEKSEELEELRRREVGEAKLSELRSWLVGAARQSGCQVRRIDFAQPSSRAWGPNDNPIEPPNNSADRAAKTPFALVTRPVALSVTGATEEVLALLKSIDEDPRLKHASNVDLKPATRTSRELQLDLTLWYFAIEKSKTVT